MKVSLFSFVAAAAAFIALVAPTAAVPALAQPEADTESLVAPSRIELQGAVNVRDIGGYRTYDGAKVKTGKVIRADSLEKLTAADVQKLAGLNLQSVVDLRTPAEVQFMGQDKLPQGVPLVARPIDDTGLLLRMLEIIQWRDPVRQEEALGGGKAEEIMANMYRNFLSPEARAAVGQTIRDIAANPKALLYHCTAGKDRTGWLTYVLLRAVGVPANTAQQDYLLSNQFRAAADQKLRDDLKRAGLMQNPELLIPLQEVRDAYLNAAIKQMEKDYGDFGKFLTRGLNIDGGTLVQLRRNIVT